MPQNDVLFEEMSGRGGDLGIMTLNRPQALNSLNHTMILSMLSQLKTWADASHIKAVVIRAAEGRAFCAGGDLKSIYDAMLTRDPSMTTFFRDEYQLNRFIFHFPKPYIALLDGITMGGGAGVSIHGSHRVATERLLFAMPETGIGFFPDVGGTYFLPRLIGQLGYYLGLTGARLTSDDCVALGIATQKIARESMADLIQALAQAVFSTQPNDSVTSIIQSFAIPVEPSALLEQRTAIDACFSKENVESILSHLNVSTHSICKEAYSAMQKKSPLSLKITLRALREGRQLDFDACMCQEYHLVCRFLQGHDFTEGVRAVLIDKDQAPLWKPNTLEDVTMDQIETYFSPMARA